MRNKKPSVYLVGVDLGQSHDYTAISIIRRKKMLDRVHNGVEKYRQYDLVHLERPPLGTPYPAIIDRLKELKGKLDGYSIIVVDATGVGAPVVDMLRKEKLKPVPIVIHGGQSVHTEKGSHHVPKRDLVSTLQVLFQTGRFRIAAGLKLGRIFEAELQNFKAKINISTGHDSYEAWRDSENDDTVLSAAIAAWVGEKRMPWLPEDMQRISEMMGIKRARV